MMPLWGSILIPPEMSASQELCLSGSLGWSFASWPIISSLCTGHSEGYFHLRPVLTDSSAACYNTGHQALVFSSMPFAFSTFPWCFSCVECSTPSFGPHAFFFPGLIPWFCWSTLSFSFLRSRFWKLHFWLLGMLEIFFYPHLWLNCVRA